MLLGVLLSAALLGGPATGGRIAYQCCESDAHIVIVDANGNGRRNLGYGISPAWSPDGKLIALHGIDVIHAEGRLRARHLADGSHPTWSSDGRSLAFEHRRGGIWSVATTGREPRRLVKRGRWPKWSPRGPKLAFERDNDLWILDIAHHRERLLIRNARYPDWSPDGRRIAFTRMLAAANCRPHYTCTREIRVVRATGGPSRAVVNGDEPTWSPDGRELAYIRPDGSALMRIRIDGTHRRRLVVGLACCVNPDWGPR